MKPPLIVGLTAFVKTVEPQLKILEAPVTVAIPQSLLAAALELAQFKNQVFYRGSLVAAKVKVTP